MGGANTRASLDQVNWLTAISDCLELVQATAEKVNAELRRNFPPEDFHFHSSRRIVGGTTLDAFAYVSEKGVVIELIKTTMYGREWSFVLKFDENMELSEETKGDFTDQFSSPTHRDWNSNDLPRISQLLGTLELRQDVFYPVQFTWLGGNAAAQAWVSQNEILCKKEYTLPETTEEMSLAEKHSCRIAAMATFTFAALSDAIHFKLLRDP